MFLRHPVQVFRTSIVGAMLGSSPYLFVHLLGSASSLTALYLPSSDNSKVTVQSLISDLIVLLRAMF